MDIANTTYPFQRIRPFDLPAEFGWLRSNAPVSKVKLASGDPAWLITRYEDVRTALTDDRFSRNINQDGAATLDTGLAADRSSPVFSFGGSISEPPGHTRWRRLVNRAFTQRQADAMRPRIAKHTDDVLDELDLANAGGPVDLMADFAYRLPIRVMCELLGIPADGRPEFAELAAKLTRREAGASFAEFGAALGGIGRYAIGLIVRKRRDLGDDLLSTLIGLRDDDDSQLSNEELVSTVILLLMAGYESTAVQFGNAFFALFHNPDQLARLVAQPALIDTAVDEIMRYAQQGTGFAVAKFATVDIEIADVTIPAGSTVFVSLGSGNRDRTVFGAEAELFDVARTSAHRHLAFGAGPHYCLGAALARVVLAEGITRLLGRLPGLRLAVPFEDVVLASNLFTYYPSALPVTW